MLHDDATQGRHCLSRACGVPVTRTVPQVPNQELHTAFMRGLQAHWQAAGGAHTITVERGSELLRRRCPVCRHTVRVGDVVVRCPCGKCGGVFHQDPLHHLTCWDNWYRGTIPTHCAFSGSQIRLTEPVQ
jgi:ribosomal protein S27AE